MRVIHKGKIEIGINPFAEMNMMTAPVRMERRLNITAFSEFSKHLFQELCSSFPFERTGGIEIVQLFKTERLLFHYFFIIGKIEFAAVHFFFL